MEKLVVNSADKELHKGSLLYGCQHSFMMKRPCQGSFQFLHAITNLMNGWCTHWVFRLQRTLDAVSGLRGMLALCIVAAVWNKETENGLTDRCWRADLSREPSLHRMLPRVFCWDWFWPCSMSSSVAGQQAWQIWPRTCVSNDWW